MNFRKFIKNVAITTAVVSMLSLLAACSDENSETDKAKDTVKTQETGKVKSAKVSINGSTSMDPLVKVLTEDYKKKNSRYSFDNQATGSSAGIKAVTDGTTNIGTSSRELTNDEKKELKDFQIALDGIAVIVNTTNKVSDLTKDQLKDIYTGKIKNWKEVGGVDKNIIVISREDGSGTRTAFDDLVKLVDSNKNSLIVKDSQFSNSTGDMAANVSKKDNAIGYMSLGDIDKSVKTLKLQGIEATPENVKSKKYVLMRPFLMCTKGEPSEDVKAFIDYVLSSDGQNIVTDNGFISIK
jgi:phosphate transport system substrate-binding protein